MLQILSLYMIDMRDEEKTKEQLVRELARQRQQIAKLEKLEAEYRQTEEALQKSEERYRHITNAITDYIYTVRMESGRAVKTVHSEACVAVTGYTKKEFVDDPYLWIQMVVEEDHTLVREQIRDILSGKSPKSIEHRIIRKDGSVRWVESIVVPHYDLNNNLISYDGIVRDITNRKKAEKQLEQQAYYDQLTHLSNRVLFTKYMRRIIKSAKRHRNYQFAVLFIDLDRFKIINDSLGHIIGDQLLISVARRLENCIRPNDVIARFGGDEFAMLLDDIKEISDVTRVADRIQSELLAPFNLSGHEVVTTASIGIALSATGYDREEDILRDADAAMYRAKNLGRARYEIFDKEMHTKAMKLLKLEADLRKAIKRKEFLVYYQPIVSLINNRITGVEALLRWQHPRRGLISPTEFIPLAEETGLISAIGEWVLWTACAQNKIWHDAGYQDLHIEVNFSARQFQQKGFSELIKRVIQDTGITAESINVEVTESIAMEDYSIAVMNELSAVGVQTSIDDFGTGFSSLSSLKRFPINAIKIDRSFVGDITSDTNAEAIVKAIIAMAHSLKMKVVAEGVETREQLAFLQSQHCDEMQGYFYSPPVTDSEFTKLLEKGFIEH
jgi:diguanylate cyclase (GGDEF)-like protein/PAS domain S-box-containing protein